MTHERFAKPRPASREEVAMVKLLLPENGFPDVDAYRNQADHLWVTGRCGCGCPSVDLLVDGNHARQAWFRGDPLLPVEAQGTGEDHLQLLLFARSGWLQYLELVCFFEPARSTFPPMSELKPVNRYRPENDRGSR
jgi:hypothetical protein